VPAWGLLGAMLRVPEPERGTVGIFRWWECRRLRFNLICFAVGVPCLFLGGVLVKPGEDYEEPLGVLLAPVIFNVAYFLGHVGDFALSRLMPARGPWAPRLWRSGIALTLFVLMAPVAVQAVLYYRRVAFGR
jgi:hypothetical protein